MTWLEALDRKKRKGVAVMADIKAVKEKFLEKKLDEDQMDMVAGGTWAQTFADANMLDFFGITSYKYNPNSRESNIVAETGIQQQYVTREDVIQAFSKVGVKCTISKKSGNTYVNMKTGKKISQQQAWKIAENHARELGFYK